MLAAVERRPGVGEIPRRWVSIPSGRLLLALVLGLPSRDDRMRVSQQCRNHHLAGFDRRLCRFLPHLRRNHGRRFGRRDVRGLRRVGVGLGQLKISYLPARRLPGPPAARWIRHLQAVADLGEPSSGNPVLARQQAHRFRPDLPEQILAGHRHRTLGFQAAHPPIPIMRRTVPGPDLKA